MTGSQKETVAEITERVIEVLGGQAATARIAECSQQTVGYWLQKKRAIPAEYVLKIEAALFERGVPISRYQIRPDVYGSAAESE